MEKKSVPSLVKDQQLILKRREQIIKGAVRLFIEKGFHRTTTREIAKESGFSIGTLYEYIGTKEDVLYLVCDAIYEEVTERLKKQLYTSGSAVERLEAAIRAYFTVIDSMQDEVLVMYQETKSLPKETLPYVLKKEEEMAAMMEEMVSACNQEGVFQFTDKEQKLFTHNLLVAGQMWTFRRWAIRKHFTLDEYIALQIKNLLKRE
ncbi:TetR/AcrR family transcriptional regulator [Alkalicoccobacillus porphyridii]|uniref:TetR/AcrR family transcriptional regulator n=1 Tax=Alkalicoccobacillus porphyridii TaxID=2597270 RepID=A0A553ZU11_9BACI|nr:TetR/AcrR family transcriptional regulator [Alkalicoccobacillus porphyridii]TSB44960.1 TetR/AcrR family transcriptional regulator [Alkalicoccobacillus porphyridii]